MGWKELGYMWDGAATTMFAISIMAAISIGIYGPEKLIDDLSGRTSERSKANAVIATLSKDIRVDVAGLIESSHCVLQIRRFAEGEQLIGYLSCVDGMKSFTYTNKDFIPGAYWKLEPIIGHYAYVGARDLN